MIPVSPPIRTDLFSLFILLGCVQGLILAYVFLTHTRGSNRSNLFLGILILAMAVIISDVWLGYTNYMFRVLWLVDFSEPLNLLMAPTAFLYTQTGLNQRIPKRAWLHLMPSAIYLVYMCVLVYPQGLEFKYNSNIGSFHPELERIAATRYGSDWMFQPKWHINDLTFASMVVYTVAGFVFLVRAFRQRGVSFFSAEKSSLTWFRDISLQLSFLVLVFFIVRVSFPHDLGDHIIAAFISLIIYITSFTVLRKSLFFQEPNDRVMRKYEKSSLTPEIQSATLGKLQAVMLAEQPFLDPGFSLPALSKRLGVSTHHLSQILNEELKQSFFDFLGAYRIREAQRLLADEANAYIKIEEIGQMVGYNSKSAFNTAFRKITGTTPSEYRKKYANQKF
ncbi:MAG: AraC family transcriptional regulator [Dyadobacter sp. 50-39]|uniref:helix-turn-helix domain-containing protein n=1 Tax=Dyadobacter sp. 50-39 TaxID=1895756 RepID=UPI000965DED1|nr:helix-turn-helix domain-containing protein [Dyadobacter sp. 50-39]OJV21325.1 MAG: AraC family transcriptional regulator [Dyadobacter sp. 50-39]